MLAADIGHDGELSESSLSIASAASQCYDGFLTSATHGSGNRQNLPWSVYCDTVTVDYVAEGHTSASSTGRGNRQGRSTTTKIGKGNRQELSSTNRTGSGNIRSDSVSTAANIDHDSEVSD